MALKRDFETWWERTPGRYQWITTTATDSKRRRKFLTNRQPIPPHDSGDAYRPLEIETLHVQFARIAPTETGVIDFANRFGFLAGKVGKMIQPPDGFGPIWHGETVSAWREQILAARSTLALWDLIRADDIRALEALFEWSDDQLSYRAEFADGDHRHTVGRLISSSKYHPEIRRSIPECDVMALARADLRQTINKHLSGHVSARLVGGNYPNGFALQAVPDSGLIGVIWLMIAETVQHERAFANCEICGQPMLVKHAAKRVCGDACRKEKSRRNQRRGKEKKS